MKKEKMLTPTAIKWAMTSKCMSANIVLCFVLGKIKLSTFEKFLDLQAQYEIGEISLADYRTKFDKLRDRMNREAIRGK